MGKAATNVTNRIQIDASQCKTVLWKNPRGMVSLANGGKFKYGVGPNGASDLLGYKPVLITPDMVGQTIAQFTVFEVKTTDKLRPEQRDFLDRVKADGGRAGYGNSIEDGRKVYG